LAETDTPLVYLSEAAGSLLGLNIDRYLAIEHGALAELLTRLGIEHTVLENIDDDDAGKFSKRSCAISALTPTALPPGCRGSPGLSKSYLLT
jgi:hypothetical protein